MHKTLLTLLLALPFAACSNHTGSVAISDSPLPPVNQPDQRSVDPTTGGNGGGGTANSQGETSNTQTPATGGGGSTANSGSGGSSIGGGGGQQNGGPVPEPSTLFLVGSGLAGLAGASLRRRRRKQA